MNAVQSGNWANLVIKLYNLMALACEKSSEGCSLMAVIHFRELYYASKKMILGWLFPLTVSWIVNNRHGVYTILIRIHCWYTNAYCFSDSYFFFETKAWAEVSCVEMHSQLCVIFWCCMLSFMLSVRTGYTRDCFWKFPVLANTDAAPLVFEKFTAD